MSHKLIVFLVVTLLLVAFAGDISAKALARWVGPIAYTGAHTRVIGVKFCDDEEIYPFTTSNLPIQAYCESIRPDWKQGGAVAYAYCDTTATGRKIQWAFAHSWGVLAWAGKSAGDTTRCSTQVISSIDAGHLSMDVYGSLSSVDQKQGAILRLDVTAGADTIFSGRAELRGAPDELTASGDFTVGDFSVVGNAVEMERTFAGIDVSAYNPDDIQIEITSDAQSYMRVPSTTPYGLLILIGLLALTAAFLVLRRYRIARI
ncbi:MAG: hypothetical protein R3F48_17580 [Candidatus Zixiibacteriota bacterium]